jgi:hypothetical protein
MCRLLLPWNSIGIEHDSFAAFCAALELNGHLQHLDLSNNGLSPSNGATLAKALEGNGILRSLDLHSNHLGNMGGSAMLKMLRYQYCYH